MAVNTDNKEKPVAHHRQQHLYLAPGSGYKGRHIYLVVITSSIDLAFFGQLSGIPFEGYAIQLIAIDK